MSDPEYTNAGVGTLIRTLNRLEWQAEEEARQAEDTRLLQTGLYRTRADGRAGVWAVPKSERALCGVRTRAGGSCQARAVLGGKRCRLHGGASTGPTSEAGKARIAASNRRRAERRRQEKEE